MPSRGSSLNFHQLFWSPGPLQSRTAVVASSPVHVAPFPWSSPRRSLCWGGGHGHVCVNGRNLRCCCRFACAHQVSPRICCDVAQGEKKTQHVFPKPSRSLPSASLSEQEVALLSPSFCLLAIALTKQSFICYCFNRVCYLLRIKLRSKSGNFFVTA